MQPAAWVWESSSESAGRWRTSPIPSCAVSVTRSHSARACDCYTSSSSAGIRVSPCGFSDLVNWKNTIKTPALCMRSVCSLWSTAVSSQVGHLGIILYPTQWEWITQPCPCWGFCAANNWDQQLKTLSVKWKIQWWKNKGTLWKHVRPQRENNQAGYLYWYGPGNVNNQNTEGWKNDAAGESHLFILQQLKMILSRF